MRELLSFNSQEKLKTMLMQNFGVTNIEHYGMLWYFLEWSIELSANRMCDTEYISWRIALQTISSQLTSKPTYRSLSRCTLRDHPLCT